MIFMQFSLFPDTVMTNERWYLEVKETKGFAKQYNRAKEKSGRSNEGELYVTEGHMNESRYAVDRIEVDSVEVYVLRDDTTCFESRFHNLFLHKLLSRQLLHDSLQLKHDQ